MGFLSNLFSVEPDLENMTPEQMVRYTDKLSAWLDKNNSMFNPPEHIKKERVRKQILLAKAMDVWQRKMIEHAEQNNLPNPFPHATGNIIEDTLDNSRNSLQDYIDFAVSKTGISNEEIQKYSINLLNQFEKEFLTQGLPEHDATASAFARLISERPLPNTESHKNRELGDTVQYEILPGIGLAECPLGSSKTGFDKIFPNASPIIMGGCICIAMTSKEHGITVELNDEIITALSFHFSREEYNDFSGKTDKGIGANSTMDEVISKYSEPDIEDELLSEELQSPTSKILKYKQLGIKFYFNNGQLKTIFIHHVHS